MKRVLITGGTGFFGKSIIDYFSRHPSEVELTVLSRHGFGAGFAPKIPVRVLTGDVRTFDVGDCAFDWVIHAATPARVDVADAEMRSIVLDGTDNAIRQAVKCGAEKFMMVSSGGVYGRGLAGPVSEDVEPRPVTAYGQAKLEAERRAVASGLFTLIPRCFAFVGPHLPRDQHFAIGNFLADCLAGRDIVIWGDGSPVRSYLYADDLVEWLWTILARGQSGRIYNVGSDRAVSIRELARCVRDSLDAEVDVQVRGDAVQGAADVYVPDIRRAQSELGLSVKTGLEDAIRLSARPSRT